MNKFLRGHKLPKLTQEEMNNLNNYISIAETGIVAKNLTERT